jgi:NAD(P)-dependent dehydrogenase (short-subunit alcohol dehydrogenase family)
MMSPRFAGKRVLITGGTGGMGLAGARRIVSEGGTVIVTGLDTGRIEAARRELADDAIVPGNDAADPATVAALVETVQATGSLDGLWLNAGYAALGTSRMWTRRRSMR